MPAKSYSISSFNTFKENRPETVGGQSRILTSLQTSFVSVFSIPQIQVSTQDVRASIFPSFVSKQRNRILSGSFETSGEREGSLSSLLFELFLRFGEEREKRIKTVCELKNSLTEHSSSRATPVHGFCNPCLRKN